MNRYCQCGSLAKPIHFIFQSKKYVTERKTLLLCFQIHRKWPKFTSMEHEFRIRISPMLVRDSSTDHGQPFSQQASHHQPIGRSSVFRNP